MDITALFASRREAKGKILVVDDQIVNIKILKQLLHEEYDIHMAKDGHQAMDVCRRIKPDLVLLDIEMPLLSGFEVCRQLKSDPDTADIAVIFITGHFDEEKEVKGFQLGAVDFIHKPINPVITKARVKNQYLLKCQTDLLRSFAMFDGLTGIANRRSFEQRYTDDWRQCSRDKQPLSIVLLDIDFFKRYNDSYGHKQGDECLIAVAHAIDAAVNRPYDLVARYGGEEFVCILPQTEFAGALHIAQTIVERVNALKIPHKSSDISEFVTISAGLVTTIPKLEIPQDSLIEAADKQLYIAKEKGRNRVSAAAITRKSVA